MKINRSAVLLVVTTMIVVAAWGCDRAAKPMRSKADSPIASGAPYERMQSLSAAAPPMPAADAMVANEATVDAGAAAAPDALSRQLVRRAALELVVGDVAATVRRAQALADSCGGYVSNLETGGSTQAATASMILRVPEHRLDWTMDALRGLAVQVRHETRSLEDVTAQAVDLDARLRTLRATEKELLAVLSEVRQRGGKVEGIMSVFRELTGIRTQIEQLEGQRDGLAKLAALATVSLSLVSEHADQPPAAATWHATDTIRSSAHALVGLLRGLTDLGIFLAIVVAPIALIVGVPAIAIVRWRRRRGVVVSARM